MCLVVCVDWFIRDRGGGGNGGVGGDGGGGGGDGGQNPDDSQR